MERIGTLFRAFIAAAALAAAILGTAQPAAAQVQTATVISPLKTAPDVNNVNISNGLIRMDGPSLSVPAAPRLVFKTLSDAVPYIRANVYGGSGSYIESSIAVHTGASSSESFKCTFDDVCTNKKQDGSVIGGSVVLGGPYTFVESQTGAVYVFDSLQYDNGASQQNRQLYWYASSITYPDGEVITFTYDKAHYTGSSNPTLHRLTRMSSNIGYHIDFTYSGTDPNYPSWGYLTSAKLYKTSAPTVVLQQLLVDGPNSTITDSAGRVFTCGACIGGIAGQMETSAGTLKLPTEAGNSLTVSSTIVPGYTGYPNSIVSSVVRDGVSWSYSYPNLRLKAVDGVNTYTYDSVVVTGPNSYSTTYNINSTYRPNLIASILDALGRTTSFTYDMKYRLTRTTLPEGNYVEVGYDAYGNITSKTSQPKPGSGLSATSESAAINQTNCDSNPVQCFRITSYTDALNRTTSYAYDGGGRLIQRTDPVDGSGAQRVTYLSYTTSFTAPTEVRVCILGSTCGTSAEFKTQYTYLGNTALPLTETVIDGVAGTSVTTINSYDDAGRLLSSDGPLAGTGDAKYFRYDAVGRKTWEIGPANADGTRPATLTYYRDADDKPYLIERGTIVGSTGTALTVTSRVEIAYDARRNPVQTATLQSGVLYMAEAASFNDRGQQICSTVRMNMASLPSDACTAGTTGSNGPDRITRNSYDAAGQLTLVQKAYGTSLQQNYAAYSYTSNGKQASVTDANGNLATLAYDGFDRLKQWTFPSKTVPGTVNAADYESYGYDAAGNRTSLRKRDGVTLTYAYDNLNRMTLKTVPASASGAAGYSVYYGYDIRGLQTYARFGSTSGQGVANAYDGYGRMTSSTSTMGGVSRTVSFLYDAAGNRTRVTHPDGNAFTFTYDGGARLTGVYEGAGTSVWMLQYGFDNLGRPVTRSERYGSAQSYGYDPVSRLSSLGDDFAGAGDDNTSTFQYNPASQITSRARTNDGYAFTGFVTADRAYAANGLNQYTSAGPATFTYDANGNLTSDGTNAYVYDAENRLVSASGGRTLAYDPLGRLWQTYSASYGTTQFLYDGDQLTAEYDGSGTLLRRYVHGAGTDDPLLWYEGSAIGPARWFHADNQGSIVAIGNASAAAIARYSYDEYGIPGGAYASRFQYTGQAWIPDLGFYYYKARMYSPTLGRFLQTDPVGYKDQINLYAYVGNDPVNKGDPSGLETTPPFAMSECQRGSSSCSGWSGTMPTHTMNPSMAAPPGRTGGGASESGPKTTPRAGTPAKIPNPPDGLKGGPYTAKPAGQNRPGSFQGPPQSSGPRSQAQWVPPESQGGPPGSQGYWKVQEPGTKGWERFGEDGRSLTAEEAHPNPLEGAPSEAPRGAVPTRNYLFFSPLGAVLCLLFCESPAR